MKKPFVSYIIVIFTIILCICISELSNNTIHVSNTSYIPESCIVIDAGHGGKDCGTIGVDGALEKDINLNIALNLYDFLSVIGYDCQMTRDGDYQLYYEEEEKSRSDLYNRLDFVNNTHNSTLISIHQNHFENEKERGMQIWYSPNDESSKLLADEILNYTKANLQKNNSRENKKSDNSYYILYKASVPSVMVECGFMSNVNENKLLQNPSYQKKLSYSIMMGYANYKMQEN